MALAAGELQNNMPQDMTSTEDTNAFAEAQVLRHFVFSRKVAIGGTIVSAVLVLMATILSAKGLLSWQLAVSAGISVVGAIMLWVRHRFAAHAWALLAGTIASLSLFLKDQTSHGILHWTEKGGYAVILFALACWLFKIGMQLQRSQ